MVEYEVRIVETGRNRVALDATIFQKDQGDGRYAFDVELWDLDGEAYDIVIEDVVVNWPRGRHPAEAIAEVVRYLEIERMKGTL